MQYRYRKGLAATVFAVAIIIALVFTVNPELRVLLFFTDSIGLDLVALLLATQLKYFVFALRPAANAAARALCACAFWIGSGALRTYLNALGWRPFDRLFCPALFFVTYGVRCRAAG
jgi:hypothetical protein